MKDISKANPHNGWLRKNKDTKHIPVCDLKDLSRTILTTNMILADKGVNYQDNLLTYFIEGCYAKVDRIFQSYFGFNGLETNWKEILANNLKPSNILTILGQYNFKNSNLNGYENYDDLPPLNDKLNSLELCYKVAFIYSHSDKCLHNFKDNLEIALPYFAIGQDNLANIYLLQWFATAILDMQENTMACYKYPNMEKAWYRLEKWYVPFLQKVAECAIQNQPIPGPGSDETNVAIAHHLEHFTHTIIVRFYNKYFKQLDVYDSKMHLSKHTHTSRDNDPRRYNLIIKDLVQLDPYISKYLYQIKSPVLVGLLGKIFSIAMGGIHNTDNPNFKNCLTQNTLTSLHGYTSLHPDIRREHPKFYIARTFLLLNIKLEIDKYMYRYGFDFVN